MFEALDSAIYDVLRKNGANQDELVNKALLAADELAGLNGGVYAARAADQLKKIAGVSGREEDVLAAILKHSATLTVDPGKDLGKAEGNAIWVANHTSPDSANDIRAAELWKEIEQKPDYLSKAGALRLSLNAAQATPEASSLHLVAVQTAQEYAAQNDIFGKLDEGERKRAAEYLERERTRMDSAESPPGRSAQFVPAVTGYSGRFLPETDPGERRTGKVAER